MYDESIKLIEMPEINSISVCLYIGHDDVFALGERINAHFDEAYMTGDNWDAVIMHYVRNADPERMNEVKTDPEAGMFAAYMSYSPANLDTMTRFESHVRTLLNDENMLMAYIEKNREQIEWD